MEQRLNDRRWRNRNRLCAFLSLIPVFGWFGFLFMGRKSGRKHYTTAGMVYCVLSMVAFGLDALTPLTNRLRYNYSEQFPVLNYLADLEVLSVLALLVLWVVCLVHTLVKSGQYLQYLSLRESDRPERNPIVRDRKWRRANLWWMAWSYFPFGGGFSLIFAGVRMKNRKIKAFGIVSLVLPFVMNVAANFWYGIGYSYWAGALVTFSDYVMFALWIICLLASFLVREEYLDARARVWVGDTHLQPNLQNGKWRTANSLWQIWTFFPVVGGIGVALAGVRSKLKKVTLMGVLLCVMSAALLIITAYLDENYADLGDYRLVTSCVEAVEKMNWLAYFLILFCGTVVHWEVLLGRANALMGYGSEFERDLDMHNRMHGHNLNAVPETAPTPPETETAPDPQPVIRSRYDIPDPIQPQTGAAVDINACTQEELMQLPGVGVIQAKRAMEYRQEKGGFRSVDEFVEVLQIKPHFAVQIFDRATAMQQAAPAARTPAENGTPRRRIDF